MAGQQPLLRKRKGQGGDVCGTAAKIPLCPTVPDPQKGTCDTPQHALSYRVNGALSLCQFCRAKNTSPARTTTPPPLPGATIILRLQYHPHHVTLSGTANHCDCSYSAAEVYLLAV